MLNTVVISASCFWYSDPPILSQNSSLCDFLLALGGSEFFGWEQCFWGQVNSGLVKYLHNMCVTFSEIQILCVNNSRKEKGVGWNWPNHFIQIQA